jgi:hypothetical protein
MISDGVEDYVDLWWTSLVSRLLIKHRLLGFVDRVKIEIAASYAESLPKAVDADAIRASLGHELQTSLAVMETNLLSKLTAVIYASQQSAAQSHVKHEVTRVRQGDSVPGMLKVDSPMTTAGPGNESYVIRESLANKIFPLEKFGEEVSDRFRYSAWRKQYITSFSQTFQIAPGILQLLIVGSTPNLSMDNARDRFFCQSLERKVEYVLFTRAKQRVMTTMTNTVNYGATPPLVGSESGIMIIRALDSIYQLSPSEVQKLRMATSQLERVPLVQTYSSYRDALTMYQEQLRDFGQPLSEELYTNKLLMAAPKTQKWRETMADLQRVTTDREAIEYADRHEDNFDVVSEFRDSLRVGLDTSAQRPNSAPSQRPQHQGHSSYVPSAPPPAQSLYGAPAPRPPRPEPRCFRCKGLDHRIRDCTVPVASVQCSSCQQVGISGDQASHLPEFHDSVTRVREV